MREIWRLKHFMGVVDAASVHGGARNLNISQPALTKSIRHLEESLNTKLLRRLPRGVKMTEEGELLYKRAREIEASWNAALIEIGAHSKGLGVMKIGGGPVYSLVHFPLGLARLQKKFPKLRVEVSSGPANVLIQKLRLGDLMAYGGGIPSDQEMADMNFKNVYLYDQNNSLYASKNHPIFLNEEYNELDTLNYPWLCLFNTQQANKIINNYFELRDLPAPDLAIVSASIDFAFKMIEQHNFLACLPTPIVEENSEIGLQKVKLEDFDWSIPTGITYHKRYQSFAPLKQLLINLRKLSSA